MICQEKNRNGIAASTVNVLSAVVRAVTPVTKPCAVDERVSSEKVASAFDVAVPDATASTVNVGAAMAAAVVLA